MKSIALSFVTLIACCSSTFAGNVYDPFRPQSKINLHLGLMPDKANFTSDRNGRALSFGYFQFDPTALNNYLDTTTSANGTFVNNYMGIAIDNISNNEKHLDMIYALSFLIPYTVSAGSGDSLLLRLGGWHLTTSFLGYDFVKDEPLTLAIAPAFAWGNLKMRRTVAGQKTLYTNPFVGVGGRVEFRLTFGQFMIGGRATYRYDFTKTLWKRKDDMMPVLPEYQNNGLAYFGYIGWYFDRKFGPRDKKL